MNAYRTLGLLFSILLAACGTSILGGGDGGTGAGSAGGNGTTGTGACSTTTNDPTIDTINLSFACTEDSDCTAVYVGNACGCACPNGAIAVSAQAAYEARVAAANAGCCVTEPCNLFCPAAAVACMGGSCNLAGLCGGVPSPESCTATSCPAGFSCTPDPEPTNCHPTDCQCVGNVWTCDQTNCVENGNICVMGI